MFYRSIRFQITVLYVIILALTLASFSALLYHNVGRGLHSNMDTLLQSRAFGISQAIDTYWETAKLDTIPERANPDAVKKRRNTNFARIAQRWVREESGDPKLMDIVVRLFDTDGAIIAYSKNAINLSDIPRASFISVLQGKPRFDVAAPETQAVKSDFRVFTTPVFERDKVAYIVQVASPLESVQIALNNIKLVLIILLPLTVLLTGVMGLFIVRVTLRPVDKMINTIHQITAANMKLRLGVPDTKDEVQDLAETFNDMLGRLERAFTTQRQLFEDLSHELKTPLTIIKGEFEVALKKVRSQEDYAAVLRSALEETDRVIKLAENLMVLARFDAKEVFLDKKKLDLGNLVQAVVNNMRALAELKEIKIFFSPAGDMQTNGDESQLKTLFLNIMDNAIKYTPDRGEIWVAAQNAGNSARITVRDTGPGIPAEELGCIFDRFYRIDKSRHAGGFGLGLSIARSIAESHNGSVEASNAPGQGATFTVILPI